MTSDLYSQLPLQLTNSLSLEKEPFIPMNAPEVRLYVCGPTVYDHAHLGHARCYLTWDVLVRFLSALGYTVRYARNITDVDDKIINRARETGESIEALAQRYTESFHQDMASLNLLPPTDEPKATEHIQHIIEGVQALIAKGFAYETADGTVYYRTASKADYGKLSRKPLDDLRAGARVEEDPNKESPLDFALWKGSPVGEADTWDSPFGLGEGPEGHKLEGRKKGRPGWHMECTAMNSALFDCQLDIHAGGADLVFPHHENEIAQSEAWSGHEPFAKYWLHNGFVNVDGEKMSKSLGNFSTIKDILKAYDANSLRYFLLTHHYRMPVNFAPDGLEGATNRMAKIHRAFHQACEWIGLQPEVLAELEPWSVGHDDTRMQAFAQAMADDLNTPQALAVLDGCVTQLNKVMQTHRDDLAKVRIAFERAYSLFMLMGFSGALIFENAGLPAQLAERLTELLTRVAPTVKANTPEATLDALIEARADAKASKNWAVADQIRNELGVLGVQLKDGPQGTMWEYQAVEKSGQKTPDPKTSNPKTSEVV